MYVCVDTCDKCTCSLYNTGSSVDPYGSFLHSNANRVGGKKEEEKTQCVSYIQYKTNLKSIGKKKEEKWKVV